jgi:hypothetical protein
MPDDGEVIAAAGSIGLGAAVSDAAGAKVLEFLRGGKVDGHVPGSEAVCTLLGNLGAGVMSGKLPAEAALVLLKDPSGAVRLFMAGPCKDGELKFYDAFGMMSIGHLVLTRLVPP